VQYEFFDNVTAVFRNQKDGKNFRFYYSTVDEYFQAVFKKQQEI
jgi:hypothetical protein